MLRKDQIRLSAWKLTSPPSRLHRPIPALFAMGARDDARDRMSSVTALLRLSSMFTGVDASGMLICAATA